VTARASGTATRTGGRRVLLVVGRSTGGIGVHVADLVRGLDAAGWDVVVATAASTAARFDLGARVVHGWPEGPTPVRLRALRRLRRLAAAADVVHAHGHQAGLLAVAATAGLRRRPPVVVSWHNAVLAAGPRARLLGAGEALQARRADLLAGASADLVERAAALGARGALLAPVASTSAGTWPGDRRAAREEVAADLGLGPGPLVLTVSRIAPQKNLDVLVEAARALADVPHLAWLLVGDGDERLTARLRERVAASGAPVRLLGARSDVPRLMAAADVFALPSAWEARALVVQEAMAAGTPVVASDVGGLPELVGDAGVLVPPGDPGALATAVRGLLDGPDRAAALGAAGRRRYDALPGEAAVLDQWQALYRGLVAARAPTA
jgi:glycosyltransferase involved in cell wall biosynthesis